MTTTAFDDQFTPATQNRLRVNVIESQQQIHDQQTRLAAAIERAEKAEEKLTTARDDMQSWIDSRNGWMERAGAAEAELEAVREDNHSMMLEVNELRTELALKLQSAPVPAPAVPDEIMALSKKYTIDTKAYHAAMDALLQSAGATK